MKSYLVSAGGITAGLFLSPYIMGPVLQALPDGTPGIVSSILIAFYLTGWVVLAHMVF